MLLACILLTGAGCARDARLGGGAGGDRTKAAFAAARDRCGVTVVETPAVLECMRAQGWAYRHPWQ